MFDQEIVLENLHNISNALKTILDRTVSIKSSDDFISSPSGTLCLDAVCMNLIALGEAVKGLDKITKGEFLLKYPQIYWSGVMRMRDKIAHHYFEVDPEVVFVTIQENIPPMIPVIEQMTKDIERLKNKRGVK